MGELYENKIDEDEQLLLLGNGDERVAFLAERLAFFDYSVNFVFQSIAALFKN